MEKDSSTTARGVETVTLTQLRKNIYQLVDEVIASGRPLTIKRGDKLLKLDLVTTSSSKLDNLKKRDTLCTNNLNSPDELVTEITHQWDKDHGFD